MNRFEPSAYRFCAASSCPVVYFDEHTRVFDESDLRMPVWQKQPFGQRMVCYCFGESEGAIRSEIEHHGRSGAVERVRAHIAARRCACEIRNPKGACCLADVTAAVRRVKNERHIADIEDRRAR